ncbi:MAG: nucleotidyltransferase domain-containing protein [Desulfobacterota bacterium]|nr:nucleotidyltransferase domain-containing protein [Thermodesulfobacteriota bacterium]
MFGSFVHSLNPHDIDIAIFQESDEAYLPLALKYRKKTRHIARRIPLDIIPLKKDAVASPFLSEINKGITVYER